MSSGTRRAVAVSYEAQARHEGAELADIRARLASGEISMRDAQLQIVEMVLHRTSDFPTHIQEGLRATLLEAVEADPYLQLVRETPEP